MKTVQKFTLFSNHHSPTGPGVILGNANGRIKIPEYEDIVGLIISDGSGVILGDGDPGLCLDVIQSQPLSGVQPQAASDEAPHPNTEARGELEPRLRDLLPCLEGDFTGDLRKIR